MIARNRQFRFASWIGAVSVAISASALHADTTTLKNGMSLNGNVGRIAAIAANPSAPPPATTPIVMVDDSLTRTFFPVGQLQNSVPGAAAVEKVHIQKRVAKVGKPVGVVGPVIRITPFDEFGNRIYTMNTGKGPLSIIQGITEVTPHYTKVEGLQTENAYIWDMRVATNSIPRDVLSKVLLRQVNPKNANDRLRLVRLYTQAERFEDARAELEGIIKDFPEFADLNAQVKELRQLSTSRMLREIKLRREAGQYQLVFNWLQNFPTQGVAGETLIQVRDTLAELAESEKQCADVRKLLEQHLADLEAKDMGQRVRLDPICKEIANELNVNTLPRLSDYQRLSSDEKLGTDQKLSIAITGWLLGSGSTGVNLAVALSSVEVRDAVRQYLITKQVADRRRLIEKMASLEGATPANVAKLLAHMKPPLTTIPQPNHEPGCFEITVPGLAETPEVTYFVQLPPEYDPYRRYPCVVSLGSGSISPKDQMQWWTGTFSEKLGVHLGLAARHGYIVISPGWTKEHQHRYEFSAREHAAVLNTLRDANRRFAIDSDRVYLSGHSMGGDAAWDIGFAHPDLWAGIIPIVATADKFVQRYWENARLLPMYFVGGEMDGDRVGKNGPEWDRYMSKTGYDVMLVDYLGRGHEHFQEEIHRIFEWMNLHRRDFFPKNFKAVSLRPWDNFFWYTEVNNYPAKAMISPVSWPPPTNTKPIETSGKILENNGVIVKSGAANLTLWLSPEMVDFSKRISVNGRPMNISPSLEVILEDVRTRGDRQHPFWAKVEP